jgi:hypothetical protein
MTAEIFDRLLYTDCRPGTGRGTGGGFQVQAQSSGVDSAQVRQAVSGLLYEVQLPWLTQRRPVEGFPLGFAHVHDESYGTAQSRYLGKAATGGRDGNHLADCLLTRDADLYGPTRPAQLWRSDLWREQPWEDRDCPRFDAADLEPGPLTVDAVADWARAVPERASLLARMLSVLEDPRGKRVIIVADDPDEAIAWIAAATLLLPSRQALGVSFKVFSASPLDTEHRVTAAPASLFPRIAPGLVGQRFVLDARTTIADEAETSERAAFFSGRFVAVDDAYDVVDAVELADMLGGDHDAIIAAWALTKPDEPCPEPDALFRWLSRSGPELLAEHGPPIAALILGSAPNAVQLRWLDAAVADKRLDLEPAIVRVPLLAAELAEVRHGQAPPQEVLQPAALEVSAYRDAESELASAILLGSDKHVDLLLCLARRHGIEPELAPPLQQRLRDFVGGWLDQRGAHHPDRWALRAEVLDCVHDELRQRGEASGMTSVRESIRKLRDYLADRTDLTDPLDCHIQAALIAQGGRAERPRVRQLLGYVRKLAESSDTADAAETAAAGLQRALLAWDGVDGDIAIAILAEMPDSLAVEPTIADLAAEQLTRMSTRPTRGLLNLLASLDKRGKAPTSGPLVKLLRADQSVRAFVSWACDGTLATDGKYFEDAIVALRETDATIVRARLDDVLAACIDSRPPDLGPAVLARVKPDLARQVIDRWSATLGTRDLVLDGRWCVRCLDYEHLPQKVAAYLTAGIRGYADRLSQRDLDTWYADVRRELGPRALATWDAIFGVQAAQQRRGLWTSRDGGVHE